MRKSYVVAGLARMGVLPFLLLGALVISITCDRSPRIADNMQDAQKPGKDAAPQQPKKNVQFKLSPSQLEKALVQIETAFKKGEWLQVSETSKRVIATLDELATEPGFDKERLRQPLWWQAVATARLKRDAQPLFKNYLATLGEKLTQHDLAAALREQGLNAAALALPEAGSARGQQMREAVVILEAAKRAIEKVEGNDDTLKIVVPSDLATGHMRLVVEENGNYLASARQAVRDAEAALQKAKDKKAAEDKLKTAKAELESIRAHAKAAEENFEIVLKRFKEHPLFKDNPQMRLPTLTVYRILLDAEKGTLPDVAAEKERAEKLSTVQAEIARITGQQLDK